MDVRNFLIILSTCVICCRSSTTVTNVNVFERCVPVDSCSGLPSGVYPSCTSCDKFVTCTNGVYGTFDCPAGQTFNRVAGRCDTTGSCNLDTLVTANTPNPNPSVTDPDATTSTTTATTSTMTTTTPQPKVIRYGNRLIVFNTGCISTCVGQAPGKYPYCYIDCKRVAVCASTGNYVGTCGYNKIWDDNAKSCAPKSSTSTCSVRLYRKRYRSWW